MLERIYEKMKITISKDRSTSLKGLLICLVVLGHNKYFTSTFSLGCQEWLYCFHVSTFFILPFFYDEHMFSWSRIGLYFKRLIWPYSYMFVLLFLSNLFLYKEGDIDVGLLDTFLTGNFYTLRSYVGFQYLWFLPAMFSMLVFKDIVSSANCKLNVMIIAISIILFIVFWVFLYRCPYDKTINLMLAKFSVFSFMLGLAMMFLGLLTKKILEWKTPPFALTATFMCLCLIMIVATENSSKHNVVCWFCRAICPIIGFSCLFNFNWERFSILKEFGKYSLPIYLFHQPMNAIAHIASQKFDMCNFLSLLLTYCLVLLLSYFLSKLIYSQERIKNFLFPR